MAISGFVPTSALPRLAPGATIVPGEPLPAGLPGSIHGGPLLAAREGVLERPGIRQRLSSAMRAAIGELRGGRRATSPGDRQTLPLHAQSTLAAHARPAGADRPRTARRAKTWKTLANPPKGPRAVAAAAGLAAGAAGAAGASLATQQTAPLPHNATQVPGATVYSYDGTGAPVAPTMQQLGVSPAMLQGLTGMAQAVDPGGPQLNATNQTNLSGLGSGIGPGLGLGLPVLGQPINVAPAAVGPLPAAAPGASGGTQAVTNRNTTDVDNLQHGFGGYGYGGISSPWDPTGGIASPWAPYGASMAGASMLGGERRGFLSRLFG